MYFNPNFLFEGISKNYSRRLMQSEPNMNARLIDKIDTTSNIANNFLLKLSKFNKKIPRSNYSRNNPSLYFNETDFKDYNELLMLRSIPIEENKKKKKKGDENLYRIMSAERRKYIYSRKLKPTPFQKNRAKFIFEKRAVLINQFLYSTSDIDNLILKSTSSLSSLKLENKDFSFNGKNNSKEKGLLTYRCKSDENLKNFSKEVCLSYRDRNDNQKIHKYKPKIKAQNYYNKRNLQKAEKIIRIKKLDGIVKLSLRKKIK